MFKIIVLKTGVFQSVLSLIALISLSAIPLAESQTLAAKPTGVYHYPGTRWYGNAKEGKYMSEQERCLRDLSRSSRKSHVAVGLLVYGASHNG